MAPEKLFYSAYNYFQTCLHMDQLIFPIQEPRIFVCSFTTCIYKKAKA